MLDWNYIVKRGYYIDSVIYFHNIEGKDNAIESRLFKLFEFHLFNDWYIRYIEYM